jgi:lipopolysaccharide/colanic/teichoic acid biosynthesis glycosyltransferase
LGRLYAFNLKKHEQYKCFDSHGPMDLVPAPYMAHTSCVSILLVKQSLLDQSCLSQRAESMPPTRIERRLSERTAFVYRYNRMHALAIRLRDVAISAIALALLSPILALAALAIVIEGPGPIVFSQRRVGKFERLFTIYKLRTMKVALCGDGVSPTSAGDSRITAVGRILRKTSIDELPQLINVLRGEMSLVGPRPEMPFIVRQYSRWQHLRHMVTPGLTGLWQTRYRQTIPLALPAATAVDLEYIHRASPVFDTKLIFDTVAVLLRPKGAY